MEAVNLYEHWSQRTLAMVVAADSALKNAKKSSSFSPRGYGIIILSSLIMLCIIADIVLTLIDGIYNGFSPLGNSVLVVLFALLLLVIFLDIFLLPRLRNDTAFADDLHERAVQLQARIKLAAHHVSLNSQLLTYDTLVQAQSDVLILEHEMGFGAYATCGRATPAPSSDPVAYMIPIRIE